MDSSTNSKEAIIYMRGIDDGDDDDDIENKVIIHIYASEQIYGNYKEHYILHDMEKNIYKQVR